MNLTYVFYDETIDFESDLGIYVFTDNEFFDWKLLICFTWIEKRRFILIFHSLILKRKREWKKESVERKEKRKLEKVVMSHLID